MKSTTSRHPQRTSSQASELTQKKSTYLSHSLLRLHARYKKNHSDSSFTFVEVSNDLLFSPDSIFSAGLWSTLTPILNPVYCNHDIIYFVPVCHIVAHHMKYSIQWSMQPLTINCSVADGIKVNCGLFTKCTWTWNSYLWARSKVSVFWVVAEKEKLLLNNLGNGWGKSMGY